MQQYMILNRSQQSCPFAFDSFLRNDIFFTVCYSFLYGIFQGIQLHLILSISFILYSCELQTVEIRTDKE